MRKIVNAIGAIIAFAGVFTAGCYQDGAPHEIKVRLIGTAAFGIGCLVCALCERKKITAK